MTHSSQLRVAFAVSAFLFCVLGVGRSVSAEHVRQRRVDDIQQDRARLEISRQFAGESRQNLQGARNTFHEAKSDFKARRQSGEFSDLSKRQIKALRKDTLAAPKAGLFQARTEHKDRQSIFAVDKAVLKADLSRTKPQAAQLRGKATPQDRAATRALIKEDRPFVQSARESVRGSKQQLKEEKADFKARKQSGEFAGLTKKEVKEVRHDTLAPTGDQLHADKRNLQRETLILGTHQNLLKSEGGQ